jgi:cell filamentation protein
VQQHGRAREKLVADDLARWKAYHYPSSDVLVNKPGIRDASILKSFEAESTYLRTVQLARQPIQGRFDLAHLQRIHQHLFQDTYEWAGQLRDVSLAKAHSNFTEPDHLRREAERIQKGIEAARYFQGSEKAKFVVQLARLHTDLNRLHPFREGNGRATREFLGQLALQAGFVLDQRRIQSDRSAWNTASASALAGDTAAIERVFAEAVRPAAAVAFERLSREDALIEHPSLASAFVQLDARTAAIEKRYNGNAKAKEHFSGHARAEILRMIDGGKLPPVEQVATAAKPGLREVGQSFADRHFVDASQRAQFLAQVERRYGSRLDAAAERAHNIRL